MNYFQGIALNEKMVDMVKTKLIDPLFILDIVHWTIFLIGLLFLFLSVILHLAQKQEPDPIKK